MKVSKGIRGYIKVSADLFRASSVLELQKQILQHPTYQSIPTNLPTDQPTDLPT